MRAPPFAQNGPSRLADACGIVGPTAKGWCKALSVRWPDALVQFVDLFNRGEYWESHEVLETPWRRNRSDFYQGLIIYASSFVHGQRGNPVGVRKQLAKVPGKLDAYRPHYMGINVNEILRHGRVCTELVLSNPGLRGTALTAAIPYPVLTLEPRLVRGDEVEFTDTSPPSKEAEL